VAAAGGDVGGVGEVGVRAGQEFGRGDQGVRLVPFKIMM
jgi:hypothetical protein